jgi:hypothetical protein
MSSNVFFPSEAHQN